MEERIPPHSDDAERSVLGAVMKNKEALFDVLEILTPEDFYSEIHKRNFGAVRISIGLPLRWMCSPSARS